MKTVYYEKENKIHLEGDYYEAEPEVRKNITILYLHGGGLLYGTRKDLPDIYIRNYLAEGYDFLALDYPLAPEYSIEEILTSCRSFILDLYDQGILDRYILFGRSAGGYLCLLLADDFRKKALPMPLRLIIYYGYYSFHEKEFESPSSFYIKFPLLDKDSLLQAIRKKQEELKSLDSSSVFIPEDLSHRFSLYVCARQRGDWPQWLGDHHPFSIPEEDLLFLPPAFVTASTGDEDVPFRIPRKLSRLIPDSEFHPVYYLPHDFDQDTLAPEGREAQKRCISFLSSIEQD